MLDDGDDDDDDDAGAPRLLQAIARDDIIPFLGIFKATNAKNEPIRAIVLTFFIAEIGILIANIESVAPVIDVSVSCLLRMGGVKYI